MVLLVKNMADKTNMDEKKKCPYCGNKNKNVNYERADTNHGSFLTLSVIVLEGAVVAEVEARAGL